MSVIKTLRPILIYSLAWAISFLLFFNGWGLGKTPDFSFLGIMTALTLGTMIGAAQYYFAPRAKSANTDSLKD